MKTRLTEKKILDLRPKAKRYEIRDEGVRGLILRVGKKGEKVWEVVVSRGGKRKRVRIGKHPAVTTVEARIAAQTAKDNALNPVAATQAKTVAKLFQSYRAKLEPQRRSWRDVQSAWDNWADERIGHIRLTDINIHHGIDLRDHVAGKAGELRAGAVIRYIRPMFAWAVDEQKIAANPWLGLKAGATPLPRDRVLNHEEWSKVWAATFVEGYPLGPFVRALMLSAQRLSNVAQMQWDEIFDDVWIIPREKVKSTRPGRAKAHEVPLSNTLADLIGQQPKNGPYVFTTTGIGPIRPGSRLKNRIGEVAGVSNWVFHDLRRTGATLMTTNGISRFTVERVLGHADNTITAIYDRASYRTEKRTALETLSASTLDGSPNVVSLIGSANEDRNFTGNNQR
jgi:site-specific recombinase XerC